MKKTVLFFMTVLLALSLVSCGKDTADKKDKEPVVFTIGNLSEPNSLDPAKIQGVVENAIYQGLYEGLVAYDYQTSRAIPGVAKSWTISDDGTVYTFKLRKSQWTDGVEITANTFVESWIRELAPETAAPYAWFPAMFIKGAAEFNKGNSSADTVGVKAIDDYTLEVTLVGPIPYALDAFAHYSFGIAPLHVIAEHGDKWTNPATIATNGPFKLKEWIPQDKLVVERNPNYWDNANTKVDEVVYLPIDDNNTAYSMFLNGEIDWQREIPRDRIKEALLRDDVIVSANLATYYYVVNHEVEHLSDPRVRKALSMSIDRKVLCERIGQSGQIPTAAIVPTMDGYPALEGNTLNIEKAKELLAEAGFPNGEGFPEFTVLYNTSDNHKKVAEYIQSQWLENLGIKVKLENQEWQTYLASKNNHDFAIARAGWGGDYQDPNTFLDMWVTGGGMNEIQYANPEYDRLIKKASEMKGGQERYDVLREAERLLVEEDQAIIPLYTYVKVNAIDMEKWGGWAPNVLDLHPVRQLYKK